jgi:phosphatidylglycerophosphate synthase
VNEVPWDQKLARILAKPLVRTPVHPNHITTLALLIGLAAAWLFSLGDRDAANWAAALFVLAAFLDHVDGELARLAGKTSRFGHYYDHAVSGITYTAGFIGIGIGMSHGVLGWWAIPLGFLAGISITLILSVRLGMEIKHGKESIRQRNFAGFQAEDILYVVGPVTWLGGMMPFLVAAGVGAPLFLIWVIWRSATTSSPANRKQP